MKHLSLKDTLKLIPLKVKSRRSSNDALKFIPLNIKAWRRLNDALQFQRCHLAYFVEIQGLTWFK